MAAAQGLSRACTLAVFQPLPVTGRAAACVGSLPVRGDHAPRAPMAPVATDLPYADNGPDVRAARQRVESTVTPGHGALNRSAVHIGRERGKSPLPCRVSVVPRES